MSNSPSSWFQFHSADWNLQPCPMLCDRLYLCKQLYICLSPFRKRGSLRKYTAGLKTLFRNTTLKMYLNVKSSRRVVCTSKEGQLCRDSDSRCAALVRKCMAVIITAVRVSVEEESLFLTFSTLHISLFWMVECFSSFHLVPCDSCNVNMSAEGFSSLTDFGISFPDSSWVMTGLLYSDDIITTPSCSCLPADDWVVDSMPTVGVEGSKSSGTYAVGFVTGVRLAFVNASLANLAAFTACQIL